MRKGLNVRVFVGVTVAAGCVTLLSFAMAAGSADRSTSASESVAAKSSVVKSAKASDNDLAGRRYRRYVRRHTV